MFLFVQHICDGDHVECVLSAYLCSLCAACSEMVGGWGGNRKYLLMMVQFHSLVCRCGAISFLKHKETV